MQILVDYIKTTSKTDWMTLADELDLDILKTYPHTRNEASRSSLSKKLQHKKDRQTDTHTDKTERITTATLLSQLFD